VPADEQPIPSVWARSRHGREKPALNREHIVREAVRLLDAEGVAALSMRRLGTQLNAGATSLYRHVANKDELIELALDEVHGELELPDGVTCANWRTAATQCARTLRAMILSHPWVASVLGDLGLAHLGPNAMRMSEDMLEVFETAGFALDEADRAVSSVVAFVTGTATTEAAWLTALARSGQNEQQWVKRIWPTAEAAVQEYPRLRKLYAARRRADSKSIRESNFDYGLSVVLDGLEARLARRKR
jgi:AcrR family transcriptional regulator